MLKISGK